MKKESLNIHFRNLELPQSATFSDVKKSYRKLAMKYHPDRNQGQDTTYAESQFKIIKLSYEALETYFKSKENPVFVEINSSNYTNANNPYHNNYKKNPYQQYKEQAVKEKPAEQKKESTKNNQENTTQDPKQDKTSNSNKDNVHEHEKTDQSSKTTFFNHLLILNTDIFKPTLKSDFIENILRQSSTYAADDFSDKNRQIYVKFFNLHYPSLAQHKEKYHWLETLSLIQYLNEIIPKISPDKYLTYQQQMKRIVAETISLTFGEYIQSHPLIKHYSSNGHFFIEDVEKKIQNESLYEFFLTSIKYNDFKINIKSMVDKFNIGIQYLSGYSLKKIDYLKILSIYEEKQVLENHLNLLFFKDKNICAKIIQETQDGLVSISALSSLDNMPLHYFINRFREILNNPQNHNIHFEKLNLFTFKANKLTLNLNNPVIKIPNALEKLLSSMEFKENPHLAHMPLEMQQNTEQANNKKDKKNIFSYFSKIFK